MEKTFHRLKVLKIPKLTRDCRFTNRTYRICKKARLGNLASGVLRGLR